MSCFPICPFFWMLLARIAAHPESFCKDHFTSIFLRSFYPPLCLLLLNSSFQVQTFFTPSLPVISLCYPEADTAAKHPVMSISISTFAGGEEGVPRQECWCPSPLAWLGRGLPLNALKANHPSNLSLSTHLSCDAYWKVSKPKPELGTSQMWRNTTVS